jgi:hypothetical protein
MPLNYVSTYSGEVHSFEGIEIVDVNAIPNLGLIAGASEIMIYLALGLTAIVLVIINVVDNE